MQSFHRIPHITVLILSIENLQQLLNLREMSKLQQFMTNLSCDIPVVVDNMMVQGSTVEHN